MGGADLVAAGEVGDGAGNLEDAVEGAGGEAELLEGTVEQCAAGRVDGAETTERLGAHGCVDRCGGGGAEALPLDGAGGLHSGGDCRGGLGRTRAQLPKADRRDLDVQVDPVEQGTGDAAAIALDERRRAAAVVPRISQVAAGAFLRTLSAMSP